MDFQHHNKLQDDLPIDGHNSLEDHANDDDLCSFLHQIIQSQRGRANFHQLGNSKFVDSKHNELKLDCNKIDAIPQSDARGNERDKGAFHAQHKFANHQTDKTAKRGGKARGARGKLN
jgi:hypothetical protein